MLPIDYSTPGCANELQYPHMRLKTNLHFHTSDDPQDKVPYSFYEGIDAAYRAGFEVIALTCHRKLVWSTDYESYAASKSILLVGGVEIEIGRKHVVILNCDATAEELSAWNELEAYRKNHPEIFVLAPHPYFYGNFSLKRGLDRHIHLFDAIEHSWFYSKWFNRNKRGEAAAKKYNKPFIATSDTHDLKFLDRGYAIIETRSKTTPAIFDAIREKNFTNVTQPSSFPEMAGFLIRQEIRNRLE